MSNYNIFFFFPSLGEVQADGRMAKAIPKALQ